MDYVAPIPTPPPAVKPVQPLPATGVQVSFEYSLATPQPQLAIWQDDYLRFRWGDATAISLLQVTKAAYDACDVTKGVVNAWQSTAILNGDVNISGLEVGPAYFISGNMVQCRSGHLRVAVDVAPPMGHYYVTLWSADAAATAAAITATFTGVDANARVWVAPAVQLNQVAFGPCAYYIYWWRRYAWLWL